MSREGGGMDGEQERKGDRVRGNSNNLFHKSYWEM